MKTSDKLMQDLDITFVGEAKGIAEYRLNKNGLRVLLCQNNSAPVVTFMNLYRIGSRNEAVGYTGATHFLEHMMFKGTKERNPEKGNGFDDLLKPIGALYNATTWFDRTNYFEVVSSQHLELCIEIEADRLRNLVLRQEDRDAEMTVVRNELERGENEPDDVLMDNMYAFAFREHPYHHPTIGWRSDVEGVPLERLKEFYNTFYWPDNTVSIIVGDFDRAEALTLIKKHFGKIPAAPHAIPQVYTVEPPQQGERRFEIRRAGDLPRVMIAYHVPEAGHDDTYALAAMENVLGGSGRRSSRLYKRLIDSGLAADASSWHNQQRDPGLFMFSATVNEDVDPKAVEEAFLDEIQKLAAEVPTADELARAKSANRKSTILAAADPMMLARQIGEAEAVVDWRWYVTYDDKFDAVTVEDVKRVAGTYFSRDNRTVGYFIPKTEEELIAAAKAVSEATTTSGKAGSSASAGKGPSSLKAMEGEDTTGSGAAVSGRRDSGGIGEGIGASTLDAAIDTTTSMQGPRASKRKPFAEQVKRTVMPNGLTMLYMPNRGTGSVAILGKMRGGYYVADDDKTLVPSVVSDMVTRGTKQYSKVAIGELLENMGTSLGLRSDNFAINFGTQVVTADVPQLLTLLNDILRNPLFEEEELDKCKKEFQSFITEKITNTGARARNKLLQVLYKPDAVYFSKTFEEQLEELKVIGVKDLKSFHQKFFSPKATIITVVGDIDEAAAIKLITDTFGDWDGPSVPEIKLPQITQPKASQRIDVPIADKASVDIVIGKPVDLLRSSPDFYAALIANAALGKDTLSSRLGVAVREKAGLTYGIYSGFDDVLFGGAPWMISLSVNPDNIDRALGLIANVVKDYVTEGISDKELSDEKGRTAGQFAVGLRTSAGMATTITQYEFIGMDLSALDRFIDEINSVTKDKVNAAIGKYLQLENTITVLSGTFPKGN